MVNEKRKRKFNASPSVQKPPLEHRFNSSLYSTMVQSPAGKVGLSAAARENNMKKSSNILGFKLGFK